MFALNIDNESGRILSACKVLPNGSYDGMPIVDTLPDGNIADYLFIGGGYEYDPLPEPQEPEPAETIESRVETLEKSDAETRQIVEMLLSGVTEDE